MNAFLFESGFLSTWTWILKYRHPTTPATPNSVLVSRFSLKTSRINEEPLDEMESSELKICCKLVRTPISCSCDVWRGSVGVILSFSMVTVDTAMARMSSCAESIDVVPVVFSFLSTIF